MNSFLEEMGILSKKLCVYKFARNVNESLSIEYVGEYYWYGTQRDFEFLMIHPQRVYDPITEMKYTLVFTDERNERVAYSKFITHEKDVSHMVNEANRTKYVYDPINKVLIQKKELFTSCATFDRIGGVVYDNNGKLSVTMPGHVRRKEDSKLALYIFEHYVEEVYEKLVREFRSFLEETEREINEETDS